MLGHFPLRHALALALGVWGISGCTPGDPAPESRRTADPPAAAAPATVVARAVPAPVRAPAPAQPAAPAPGHDSQDWNDAHIAWQPYDKALVTARAQHKPVCLVFYATWCPHCKNFAKVFDDPKVVARAKDLVMVRLDSDADAALSSRFAPDGQYIPRTFFLGPDGQLDASIAAPRDTFRYFYDEHDASSLLDGMQRALAHLDRAR